VVVGWDESKVKRDYRGRFARFESGSIPGSVDLMSGDEADSYGLGNFPPFALDPEEAQAFDNYVALDYQDINSALRDPARGEAWLGEFQPEMLADVQRMDDVTSRLTTDKDLTTSRLMTPEAFGGLGPDELVGKTFTDNGFMSTELSGEFSEITREAFEFEEQKITMRLDVPKGTEAFYTTDEREEHELILARGTSFEVKGVREVGDGEWEVFAEVRPEDDEQESAAADEGEGGEGEAEAQDPRTRAPFTLNENAESAVRSAEDSIANNDYETGIILDPDTGAEIMRVKGEATSVTVTTEMRDAEEGMVYTHNHPLQGGSDELSFSDADVAQFTGSHLVEMRAVTPNWVFRLGWPEGGEQAWREWRKPQDYSTGWVDPIEVWHQEQDRFGDPVDDPEGNRLIMDTSWEEFAAAASDLMMQRTAARLNLSYTREPRETE
jgi:hypothetical protein